MTKPPPDLAAILDEILAGWDEFVESAQLSGKGTGARKGRNRTGEQTALVLGLVTHVHETARALRGWMPDRLTVVHMPLVRSVYETTLTSVWCDEVDDAWSAMANEEAGFHGKLADTFRMSDSTKQFADAVPFQDWKDLATSSGAEAKRFYMLSQRVALENAYGYYRILSHYSHPSVKLAEEYITPMETDTAVHLRRTPEPLSSPAWSAVVAECMVWAGTVANYYDPTRSRRNPLRVLAKRLGVPAELPIRAFEGRRPGG